MAQIKMDVSEYETMKENAKLLQISLDREKELQGQIEALNKEKIKVLEDAKMQVIHIKKERREEVLLSKYKPERVIELLKRQLTQQGYNSTFAAIEHIQETFSEKTHVTSFPVEEYTTKGLDEVKQEIAIQLKKQIDDDTKAKLEEAERLLKSHSANITKIQELEKVNTGLTTFQEGLEKEITDLKTTQEELIKQRLELGVQLVENDVKLKEIKAIVVNKYSFWQKFRVLHDLSEFFNK